VKINRKYKRSKEKWSSFSIASKKRVERSWLRLPTGKRNFYFMQNVLTITGVHPASYRAYRGHFSRVKRSGSEADHLPLSSAEIKNKWSCISALRIRLHGVDMDNFTFLTFPKLNGCFPLPSRWIKYLKVMA